ncbi:MAG: pilus assembly protein [Gemmataceae bacterium]|nr:pilus assembly protein [Gemmataceae bacterium]
MQLQPHQSAERHARARRFSGRPGVSTVEFALVAPVFVLFVLGVIEIGRGLMVVSLLNNSARAGCRVGILDGSSDTDISSAVTSALQGQNVTGITVTVHVNGTPANASTAVSGDRITVFVSVPITNVTWVPGSRFFTGNLSGQCTLRRE